MAAKHSVGYVSCLAKAVETRFYLFKGHKIIVLYSERVKIKATNVLRNK